MILPHTVARQREREASNNERARVAWRELHGQSDQVARTLTMVAWIVLVLGALAAVAALISGLASGSPVAGALAAGAAAIYTAAGWGGLMLGSVLARYVALKSTDAADRIT